MSNLTNEQIEVAVNWWADLLGKGTPTIADQNKSAELEIDPINIIFLDALLGGKREVTGDVEAFKAALRVELENAKYVSFIGVDYHPTAELRNALTAGGFKSDPLPWKTGMGFYSGGVSAHCGYGSPNVQLLPETEES